MTQRMRAGIRVSLVVTLAATSLQAQKPFGTQVSSTRLAAPVVMYSASPPMAEKKRPWRNRWWATVALLAAANVADLHSSRGLYETNPLLRDAHGRFNLSRGAAIKSAATGGFVLFQLLLLRKKPDSGLEKPFAVTNAVAAGAVAATAARNYAIRR